MKIKNIAGFEVLNALGIPTLMCQVTLKDGSIFSASVPTGTSRGKFEASELRDNDPRRFGGMGVKAAIDLINTDLSKCLINQDPDFFALEGLLACLSEGCDADIVKKFGANTTLALDIAIARAQAYSQGCTLSTLLSQHEKEQKVNMPKPLFNCFQGGLHASNNLTIQEVLLVCKKEIAFPELIERAQQVYQELGKLLAKKQYSILVGIEGGYAPFFQERNITPEEEAFQLLSGAIEQVSQAGELFGIGIDAAASTFYSLRESKYTVQGHSLDWQELLSLYDTWHKNYDLMLIEDPFDQEDWPAWSQCKASLTNMLIVGDDLLATHKDRICTAIEKHACSAAIIKPNQVGTLARTLAAILEARQGKLSLVASHRSGETSDPFIAELAYGLGMDYIKAGGLSRGERVAKYNWLSAISQMRG